MKKIRFDRVLLISWRNVDKTIDEIQELIAAFRRGEIQAAKARRNYYELKRVLYIDGDRFAAILAAAQKYNAQAFGDWTLAPLDAACNEFREFFEN